MTWHEAIIVSAWTLGVITVGFGAILFLAALAASRGEWTHDTTEDTEMWRNE